MQTHEFAGQAGFHAALQALVAEARARRLRRLSFVDESFLAWPLEQPGFTDALTAFLREPGRRLLWLGRDYESLRVRAPRFTAWRRTWGHALDVLSPADEETALPCLAVADRALGVWVRDREAGVGRARVDHPDAVRAALDIDAWTQRSVPAFAPTTLGL